MGCDIHVYAERKVDGKWKRIPNQKSKCDWCDGQGQNETRKCKNCEYRENEHRGDQCLFNPGTKYESGVISCWRCKGDKICPQPFYRGRNYSLFARLSNVRGVDDTGLGDSRGMPHDACWRLKAVSQEDQEHGDYHSHSYATVRELREVGFESYTQFAQSVERLATFAESPDDVRLIWWFDK